MPGEDLYFGTQDNGPFGTIDAAAGSPTWINRDCCDIFDFAADANRTVYTFFSTFRIFLRGANLAGGGNPADQPSGDDGHLQLPRLDRPVGEQLVHRGHEHGSVHHD